MADDAKPRPKRPPSIMGDDKRAEIGKESRITPRSGVPIEPFDYEDNSQTYEGAALREFREQQTPLERIGRLEEKSDETKRALNEMHTDLKAVVTSNATVVGELRAFMSMQPRTARNASTDAIALVAQQAVKTTLADRVLDEQAKSKKFRRTFILSTLKLFGLVVSAGGGGALLHWLIGRHP